MHYSKPEFLDYRIAYIDKKSFCGLAPLLHTKHKPPSATFILHAFDNHENTIPDYPRFGSIVRKTLGVILPMMKTKRNAVFRFVIIDKHIFLDPWYDGIKHSSVFNRCVYIHPDGYNYQQINTIGKAIIRLGGYVTNELRFYTDLHVKRLSEMSYSEMCMEDVVSAESIISEYESFYNRKFYFQSF